MIPLVNDNSSDAINTSLIAVKRELQTLLDAIKKINPTQEIIEQGGGEITELTQAEYDALTPEQKADGTVRVISDSEQTPVDLAGLVIDDNTVANNKTWSSNKIESLQPKLYIDYSRVLVSRSSSEQTWTATEDCYVVKTVCTGSTDTSAYPFYINNTRVDATDSWGGANAIFSFFGFCKKGDVLRGKYFTVYGLRS